MSNLILAIETSCDDTSCAVVKMTGKKYPKFEVLSNIISSQIKIHAPYGGVVPTLAAREHVKNLPIVFKKAMKKSGVSMRDIDYIAVTKGPGLVIALLTGIAFARGLAYAYDKKIIPVNHIAGHIASNWLFGSPIIFPLLNVVVSGGHTELILMQKLGQYRILGSTRDDAAGEAFDKVARMLGLGYPGGPIIAKLAKNGDSARYGLPRPMIGSKNYDFSFSGLKTAVFYMLKANPKIIKNKKMLSDFCASFEQAVSNVIIKKSIRAALEHKVKTVALSGGVSANKRLRNDFAKIIKREYRDMHFIAPQGILSTDNAAMIAVAAYLTGKKPVSWKKFDADAHLIL